jgi:hypothetical protein
MDSFAGGTQPRLESGSEILRYQETLPKKEYLIFLASVARK